MRLLLVLGLALAVAPSAGAFCVSADPGYSLGEIEQLRRAAVGLVVPDAGPTTSRRRALASLRRGEVVNSLHGELPSGPQRLAVCELSREGTVGVPSGGEEPNDRRYAIRLFTFDGRTPLLEEDEPAALLTSTSTRIPGLVSIGDVAHRERLGIERHPDAVGYLRDLDARIRDNGRARVPAGVLATAILAALAWWCPRAAALGFGTLALGNLVLGTAGVSSPWLVVPLLALATLAAVPLAGVLRTRTGAGIFLAGVVAAYLVALGLEGTWVALSPLGPSQNGRFFGISNLLATLLLVPALAGAWLLGHRWGWPGFAAVAGVSLVAVAGSRFGADGGGAIVLAAALALLAVALSGGGRRAVVAAGLAGAAAVAVVALDAVFGPATHVGASVRGGPGEILSDVADRLAVSWARATASPAVALAVAASLVALAVLVVRGPRRPLPLAFAAAIGVSMIVNDSPREVAVGGLVGYLALSRWQADSPEYTGSAIGRGAEVR